MNHNIAGMPPSLSMSRGQNNMYFPCGGPGAEPPHMQRGPCFPLPDDKLGGVPPGGLQCGMVGEFKSPLIDPPNIPIGNPKKKRRTSAAVTPQQSPVLQDLMPQQPSTLGDTIVASNPFDDTPPQPNPSTMMGHHMHMGMHMNSPMHSPHNLGHIGPPMSSPMNSMGMTMVGNPMSSPLGMGSPMGSPHMLGMMNGGPMGPMGSPMSSGPSMMGPSGPIGSPMTQNQHMNPNGAMGSPMSNNSMNMMNSNMVGNPMTSPLAGPPIGSPMIGSPHMNIHNGPMGSPMTQTSTVMNCGPSPNSCGPSPNSCSTSTTSASNLPPCGQINCTSTSGSANSNNNNNMTNCGNTMSCSANVQCGPSCGPRLSGGCLGPRMMPPPAMGHMPPHMMGPHSFTGPKPLPVSAGKVYPPDQPMVFNPQNPNAPPIYPCGICHKEVHDNDQAILCESGCNFWFHRMCTGLTEPAYQLLTAEVYAEWVCDKCLNSKNIPLVKFKP